MTSSSDRLDRIEALLQQSVIASNERMTRLEQTMAASNEQTMATEKRLERLSEKTDARFNQLADEAEANRQITFEMLSQLTALQEESKQILQYLFGQQRNGKGDQPQT